MADQLYEGPCHGGPLDGTVAVSRKPKGFLAIDKALVKVWLYEWDGETSHFEVRDAAGEELNSNSTAQYNRFRAAEEGSYDVLAVEVAE